MSPTTITTSTTALASIADTILADAKAQGALPSKQRLLNTFAAGICGPKHDWGYLTNATRPIVQKGMAAPNGAPTHTAPAPVRIGPDHARPVLTLPYTLVPLYAPDMAAYFAHQMAEDILAVVEEFSTAGEHQASVQCMFDPMVVRAKGAALAPASLWGATPALIEATARAYFAATSSAVVNDCIQSAIEDWPEEGMAETYKAFHLPHVLIITTAYPFDTLAECGLGEDDEDADGTCIEGNGQINGASHGSDAAIQVFVDESLSAQARQEALVQAEDLLNRLASFMGAGHTAANIALAPRA